MRAIPPTSHQLKSSVASRLGMFQNWDVLAARRLQIWDVSAARELQKRGISKNRCRKSIRKLPKDLGQQRQWTMRYTQIIAQRKTNKQQCQQQEHSQEQQEHSQQQQPITNNL